MNNLNKSILFATALVILTTACKYFFGPAIALSGFSPVLAIALFSGFVIRKKEWLFFFSLTSLFISDLAIELLYQNGLFYYAGVYGGQWKNYLLLLSTTFIGYLFQARSVKNIFIGAFTGTTLFFLLSNGLVWLYSSEAVYSKDAVGLFTSYVAGLPFYKNSLLSTLVFLPAILFLYNYISQKKSAILVA